ncbi:MAG TPA: hypothetical protein VFY91_15525 [Microbacterium sp.]|nr:hypothetical protein [Microbacterium sp.]
MWRLSFHDTMNTTTTPEGAVNVPRKPEDDLPRVVALSNRGDHEGEPRPEDPFVSMSPVDLRALAAAHRAAFGATEWPEEVLLNKPYLGSQEVIDSGKAFEDARDAATAAGVRVGAVQAEFLREFLLGPEATAQLHRPGTDWPALDHGHTDAIARACRAAWDTFRGSVGG